MNTTQKTIIESLKRKLNKGERLEVSCLIDILTDNEKIEVQHVVNDLGLNSPKNLWYNFTTQTYIG